jgi:hypothetical protein
MGSAISVFGIVADLYIERSGSVELFWLVFGGVAFVIYAVFRFFKKKTRALDMEHHRQKAAG